MLARKTFRKKGYLATNQRTDLPSGSREISAKDKMVMLKPGGYRFQALHDTDMYVFNDRENVTTLEGTHVFSSPRDGTSHTTVQLKHRTKGSQQFQYLNKFKNRQRHVSFKSHTGVNHAASPPGNPVTEHLARKDRDPSALEMNRTLRGNQIPIHG